MPQIHTTMLDNEPCACEFLQPKPTKENAPTAPSESNVASKESSPKPNATPQPVEINKQIPAGIHCSTTNNYFRGDGQNTCNLITICFCLCCIPFFLL